MTRREIMQTLSKEYPVRFLCAVVGVSPSSYYYEPHGRDDLALLSQIEGVLVRFPTYGYRRVSAQLRRHGWQGLINSKRVRRIMRENDLVVLVKRRPKTTNSRHGYGRYPNLVQGLEIVRPDQVWCGDITYIRLRQEYIYRSAGLTAKPGHCDGYLYPQSARLGTGAYAFERVGPDRVGAGAAQPSTGDPPLGSRDPVCGAWLRRAAAGVGSADQHGRGGPGR